MKTMTLALVLVAAIGCSKKQPVANPTTAAREPAPAATKQETPVDVSKDQQVSPNIALSGDIAAMCGIKPAASTAPKFEYDQDELTADDRAVLEQLAACLTSGALKGRSVSLIGRADPRGTEEYNLGLGSRRAASVSTFLGRLGVDKAQMAVTTRGALDASGSDEAGWAQDRRVDIQLQATASAATGQDPGA